MANTSARAYRINIKRPVYCEVLTDTASGTTYGTVKTLGEIQEAQITPQSATGRLYGDGGIVDSSALLTGVTLALQLTKIPVEAVADIYNYTVTNGVVQVKAGTTAKMIAVGFEVVQSDGSSEYTWLLKGRPQAINNTVQQSTDNINYSTDTLTIEFVKRISDEMIRYYADSANADFTAAQAEKWFEAGPAAPVTA